MADLWRIVNGGYYFALGGLPGGDGGNNPDNDNNIAPLLILTIIPSPMMASIPPIIPASPIMETVNDMIVWWMGGTRTMWPHTLVKITRMLPSNTCLADSGSSSDERVGRCFFFHKVVPKHKSVPTILCGYGTKMINQRI